MPSRVERRSLQFGLGGEFGINPEIDAYCRKVLGLLPHIQRYQLLVILPSLDEDHGGTVSKLTVRTGRDEVTATVLSGINSFKEYCPENHVRGMIIIVPRLALNSLSFPAQEALEDFFKGIGEVKNPEAYRVWIVDKDAADLLTQPKTESDKRRLAEKKKIIKELGLCGVEYHHSQEAGIGWFVARPYKKIQRKERDYSGDERIKFLQKWMEMVVEYRGGTVISSSEMQGKLRHSRSYLTATQMVSDANGVYSEGSCGCLVYTNLRGETQKILKCEGENCYEGRKPRDSRPGFRLGKEYPISKCGDCGGPRTVRAYWADMGSFDPEHGIKVTYQITCNSFGSHSRQDNVWVDPGRIQNPMYIFNCLHPKKVVER